jgi:hypothetical protein
MHFTVFYAWQSDCSNSTNRSLIERAVQDAINAIKADAALEASPRIDSDTKNVPGTPDIANTILAKIDDCGVFLADVTFTGKTRRRKGRTQKLAPNSNVLFELGYAVNAVGWDRIILIMNEEFGPPEEQFFDLRHRKFPIRYRVSEDDANKADARSKLTNNIKQRLLEIIQSGVLKQQPKTETIQSRIAEDRKRFEDSLKNNSFHKLAGQKGIIAVSLIPEQPLTNSIDVHSDELAELRPIYASCGSFPEYRAHRLIQVENERESLVELTDSGVIKAANTSLLGRPVSEFEGSAGLGVTGLLLPAVQEGAVVLAVQRYLKLLRTHSVECPIHVGISLLRMRGYKMLFPTHDQIMRLGMETGRVLDQEDIVCDPIVVPPTAVIDGREDVRELLMSGFVTIWNEFGFRDCHTGDLQYHY